MLPQSTQKPFGLLSFSPISKLPKKVSGFGIYCVFFSILAGFSISIISKLNKTLSSSCDNDGLFCIVQYAKDLVLVTSEKSFKVVSLFISVLISSVLFL